LAISVGESSVVISVSRAGASHPAYPNPPRGASPRPPAA
jgi:hypothetical protein